MYRNFYALHVCIIVSPLAANTQQCSVKAGSNVSSPVQEQNRGKQNLFCAFYGLYIAVQVVKYHSNVSCSIM